MLAVGGATTSFASTPAAGMRGSVAASDGRRSFPWCRSQAQEARFLPNAGLH
jgi:hypothetical protein